MLGMLPGTVPKFVRRYADVHAIATEAIRRWAGDVRARTFPSSDESYG
jgi:3-methyl-2-oxobutanoate hydroxymethyltransferase